METKIIKKSRAGSFESNDLIVEIEPCENLEIIVTSVVFDMFGDQIKKVVEDVLNELDVKKAKVIIDDRGALDYTIKSRVKTAVRRSSM